MINSFSYCIKKNEFFKLTEGYPPRTVSENYEKKTSLQWKLMELGGIPSKNDEYFHWGPIFYVCSFASNRVPFMYNYYIRNSLWVAAILDIWSSQTGTFQQNKGPPKWSISFHIVWKNEFFKLTEGYPPRPVSGNYDKNFFLQWKPIKWMNIFTGDLYSMYVVLKGIWSLPYKRVYMIYVLPFGE